MNKTFKDLQCGDYVYLLEFATLGAPMLTKQKIVDIKHGKSITHIKTYSKTFDTRNEEVICILNSRLLISNKEEAINRKKRFLKGMIKRFEDDIKRLNKNIKEYTKYLNNLNKKEYE